MLPKWPELSDDFTESLELNDDAAVKKEASAEDVCSWAVTYSVCSEVECFSERIESMASMSLELGLLGPEACCSVEKNVSPEEL